jgi:tetratricopeptide (TPR) repeat protein
MGFWEMVGRPSPRGRAAQIEALSSAIAQSPDLPALYLYRAEAYAGFGQFRQAVADFQRAAELADGQCKTKSWGVVAQVIRDRALRGLKQAQAQAARASTQGGEE